MTEDNLQRIEHIRTKLKAAEEKRERTHPLRWRSETIHPHMIKLECSFLRYNIRSGRTRREQQAYLTNNPSLPRDLFDDPESEEAQNAQEKILEKMIDEAGLRKDLLDEGQKEPAIITFDGYIINGNRRLAALRKVGEEWMECIVLPSDATPKELYELELDLQMAKDTKMKYDWLNELLHICYGIEYLEESIQVLAKKMRLSDDEIKSGLRIVKEIYLYLDWLSYPKQYHLISESDKQEFSDLAKYTKKITDIDRQTTFRNEVFAIIHGPALEGRKYDSIRRLFNNFINVQNTIAKEAKLPIKESEKKKNTIISSTVDKSKDPLGAIAEVKPINDTSVIAINVGNLFNTPTEAKEHHKILIESIQGAHEESRDKKDRRAAYTSIKKAHSYLQGLTIDSTTMEIDAINSNLNEIIRIAKDYLIIVKNYIKPPGNSDDEK